MPIDVTTLSHKLDGQGISFETIMSASPLLSLLFYEYDQMEISGGKSLKPKEMPNTPYIMDDGFTVRWQDIDKRPKSTTVDGAVAGAATAITVLDVTIFTAGDSVYVPSTRETFLVTSIAGSVLTITPAVAAGGIADLAEIKWVSFATGLGTASNKPVSIDANDEQTNFMQHTAFDLPFDSEKLNKTYTYYQSMGMGADDAVVKMVADFVNTAKARIFEELANTFFVGKKASATISGATRRVAGGFNEYYTDAPVDVSGANALARFDNIMNALRPLQAVKRVNGKNRILLICSPAAAQKLTSLALDLNLIQFTRNIDALGFTITRIETVMGSIDVYSDAALQNLEGLTANIAYAINPEFVRLVGAPNLMTAADVSGDMASPGRYEGIVIHAKPQQLPNSIELAVYTNFSFVFGGNTVGAGIRMTNIGA